MVGFGMHAHGGLLSSMACAWIPDSSLFPQASTFVQVASCSAHLAIELQCRPSDDLQNISGKELAA